jgi:hypothetical protein
MSATVIAFPNNTTKFVESLFVFKTQPTVEELLARHNAVCDAYDASRDPETTPDVKTRDRIAHAAFGFFTICSESGVSKNVIAKAMTHISPIRDWSWHDVLFTFGSYRAFKSFAASA